MDVYCDYRRTTPGSAGEMRLAAELHGWYPDSVLGDLPELAAGMGPASPPIENTRFFARLDLDWKTWPSHLNCSNTWTGSGSHNGAPLTIGASISR